MADEASNNIAQLLVSKPYNPEILPDLEQYVDHQISTGSYNLEANITLLRLYLFEPSNAKQHIIARILIKAIMALPRTDLTLCLCLVPERQQNEQPTATVVQLGHLLETAQFSQFWREVERQKELFKGVAGFQAAAQAFALHVLQLSHRRVPLDVFSQAVNLEGQSRDDFVQRHVDSSGWLLSSTPTGQVVEFPSSSLDGSSSLPVTKSEAGIRLEHVARLFPLLS